MATCAYCNATIVFGGRQLGDYRFCNTRCLVQGRALVQADDDTDVAGFRETIRELREDVLALADEVQQQRAATAETAERLDFVERALVQLRDAGQRPAGP